MLGPGDPLPVVEVTDAAGMAHPLRDHIDRPTLLIFVKKACETTRIALPVYVAWRRHEPEVRLLALSQDGPEETAALFADLDVDLPVVYDRPPYAASAAFDLPGIPAVFLALGGEIVFSGAGWYREAAAELAEQLGALAGEAPFLDVPEGTPVFRPG